MKSKTVMSLDSVKSHHILRQPKRSIILVALIAGFLAISYGIVGFMGVREDARLRIWIILLCAPIFAVFIFAPFLLFRIFDSNHRLIRLCFYMSMWLLAELVLLWLAAIAGGLR
jgi:hypothetical protein